MTDNKLVIKDSVIVKIRQYSIDNYEKGFDTIVECYTDDEIREFCEEEGCTSLTKFIKEYKKVIKLEKQMAYECY